MVTTNTKDRIPFFANPAHAREAIETLYRVKNLHAFLLYAFVIMPDHCHFLMYVEAPETVSHIMNAYKSGLTFDLGIPRLWQRRFYIRVAKQPIKAMNYIHLNPVRADLAPSSPQYPWSSASGKWIIDRIPKPYIIPKPHPSVGAA